MEWDAISYNFTTYGTSYCYWTGAAAAICITACFKSDAVFHVIHLSMKRKLYSTNCHFTIVPAAICLDWKRLLSKQ